MPPVGFEPTISVGERPQTCALDRAATGTGFFFLLRRENLLPLSEQTYFFRCLMISFYSLKYNKLISASYESPFLRKPFKTLFTESLVRMQSTSWVFLQATCASRTTDVPKPLCCHPGYIVCDTYIIKQTTHKHTNKYSDVVTTTLLDLI